MSKFDIFRDGHVHVAREMCSTCIFRPGNVMQLEPGRVKQMIEDAQHDESAIVCHNTLHRKHNAVCRGFYDRYPTQPLQVAYRLNRIRFVEDIG